MEDGLSDCAGAPGAGPREKFAECRSYQSRRSHARFGKALQMRTEVTTRRTTSPPDSTSSSQSPMMVSGAFGLHAIAMGVSARVSRSAPL